jgi:hypothetical protein
MGEIGKRFLGLRKKKKFDIDCDISQLKDSIAFLLKK